MKVATFNANSIRTRLPIVLEWLEREQPDVLCIQETKVQDKDFPSDPLREKGYEVVFTGQKSYNGVAIVTRSKTESVRRGLYEKEGEEARFMAASVSNIPIINAYVPQGFAPNTEKFDYKLRWLKDLLSFLRRVHDPGQPLLVAGDFNVALDDRDVFDPKGLDGEVGFHPDERAAMRDLLSWGLVDLFRRHQPEGGHYTFWDYRIPNGFKRNLGWRIDYLLATKSLADLSEKAWIDKTPRAQPKPSDHTFLIAEFRLAG
jgi:exodeoxyribonuclease III